MPCINSCAVTPLYHPRGNLPMRCMDTLSGEATLSFLFSFSIVMGVNSQGKERFFFLKEQRLLFKRTLKCLSIATPKIINFPFVSNGKLMIFKCPNIQTDYNEAVLCLNFGTPENNEFSIWDKWKIHHF